MTGAVLDANVLLKGALSDDDEDLAGAARRIRAPLAERFGLVAPGLAAWEVGNVVHVKAPDAFGEDPSDRARVVEVLVRDVRLDEPGLEDLTRTGEIAESEGLTFYDAAYLELAERTHGLLVTEDARLLEAGRSWLSADRCLDVADAFHRVQDGVL